MGPSLPLRLPPGSLLCPPCPLQAAEDGQRSSSRHSWIPAPLDVIVSLVPPCLPHCRSNLPDSVLKQPADILVKTNLILFLFWDRWKEIDAFVSNKKERERERDNIPLFFLTAIFLEQKLEAVTPARTEPVFREAGARLVGTAPSMDKAQSFTQLVVPKSPDLRTRDAI